MRNMATVGKGSIVRWRPQRVGKKSVRSRTVRQSRTAQRPELHDTAAPGPVCGFGATCVGVLLERMRLHLGTQRFLAARRGDRMWEASCDYAALSLERLQALLRPGMFEQPLFPQRLREFSANRKARGGR
jgi:hypothetical protein